MGVAVPVQAAGLTTGQANSLIAVVQSAPGVPASAFVNLITAFSNITVNQATSLIAVVQSAPGVAPNAFVGLLISFTTDMTTQTTTQATTQPIPATTQTVAPTSNAQPTVSVKTTGANYTTTTALLAGYVSTTGMTSQPRAWFDWGTSTNGTLNSTNCANVYDGNTLVSCSANVSNLTPGTTYYYRIVADGPIGEVRGGFLSFTTPVAINPSIAITSPNSGAYWYRGAPATVTWQTRDIPQSNSILVRLRGVSTNQEYNLATVANNGATTITVPDSMPYDAYYVEVKASVGSQSYLDASDQYIKIVQPSIIITNPNSSAYWTSGAKGEVSWNSVGIPTDNAVLIRLRDMASGQEYELATVSAGSGNATPSIPGSIPLGSYYVEIKTAWNGQSYIDSSDTYIKIIE